MRTSTLFLSLLAAVTPILTASVHQFLKTCKRSDPNLNECFSKSVEAAFPVLAGGVPELEIPVLDPQDLGELVLSKKEGNGKEIDIDMKLKNAKSIGLKQFKMTPVSIVDLKNGRHTMFGKMNEMHFEGQYTVDGTVLQQPIQGQGDAKITIAYAVNFDSDMKFVAGPDGKKYIKYPDPKMEFKPTSFKIHLTNLFNGNKQLGDKMNELLNKNWEKVLGVFTPVLKDICTNQMLLVIHGLANHIPVDVLFP